MIEAGRPLPAARPLRRRARGPHASSTTVGGARVGVRLRGPSRGDRRAAGHRARPSMRRSTASGRPRRLPGRRCAGGSREGRGHRRGRVHRLAPRRSRCWPTATRSRASTPSSDYYPRAVEGAEPRAAAAAIAPSAWSRDALQDLDLAAPARGRGPGLPPGRPGRACARPGAASSRTTRTTTSSPPSACWRRRVAAGGPRVVYASSSSVYGDAPALPLREDARLPARLALRRHQAGRRAPGHPVRAQPRPARGEPALLHGLRPAAAAGHGLPPLPEGGPRRRAHPASSGTASRPAISRTSTTSWPPRGPPPTPDGPAASTTLEGASGSSLNDVLEPIEQVTGRRLTVDARRGPERAT